MLDIVSWCIVRSNYVNGAFFIIWRLLSWRLLCWRLLCWSLLYRRLLWWQLLRWRQTTHTIDRGYSAQRGYFTQSVCPLLGLHILCVSQTWAPKPFQHLFTHWVAYCWKSSHISNNVMTIICQCVLNLSDKCWMIFSDLWPYGIDQLTVTEPAVRPQNWK